MVSHFSKKRERHTNHNFSDYGDANEIEWKIFTMIADERNSTKKDDLRWYGPNNNGV